MATEKRRDNAPRINETPQANTGLQSDTSPEQGGRQRSTAPDASFSTGAGEGALGYDSPPIGSQTLGNTDVEGVHHADPIFPPGGPPDADTNADGSE